MNKQKV